jgi:hypothetical protein
MATRLIFEKTVSSFPKLMKEVDLLDLDSGIRTFGNYLGRKRQFVFVTRSPHDSYTLMVYGRKERSTGGVGSGHGEDKGPGISRRRRRKRASGRKSIPGKRLMVKEFGSKEDLGRFMLGLLSRPVKAFVY